MIRREKTWILVKKKKKKNGFNSFCQRLRVLGIFKDPICKKKKKSLFVDSNGFERAKAGKQMGFVLRLTCHLAVMTR